MNPTCVRVGAALLAAVVSFGSWAGTTRVWKGTSAGGNGSTFADARNWEPQGVPATGDTLTFNAAATLTDALNIGASGMTIICYADVKASGVISGAGKLTKDGGNLLQFSAANTYSGGTLILNGELRKASSGKLGTGAIEIRRASDKTPRLAAYMGTVANDINITGPYKAKGYELDMCQETTFSGTITCETDFDFWDHYQNNSGSIHSGAVSAHDQTAHLWGYSNTSNGRFYLNGTYDCSLVKDATVSQTYVKGRFTDPNATCQVLGGPFELMAGAYFGCKTVTIDNSANKNASVQIDTAAAFSGETELVLLGGATVNVPAGVTTYVPKLTVGTDPVANGTYTKSTLSSLEGDGTLVVGSLPPNSTTKTWQGGASGAFNVAGNWDPPYVPSSGDTLTFNVAATLTDDIDIGANGMTFVCNKNVTANGVISGTGKLTKDGTNLFEIKKPNTFSGGLLVLNGAFCDNDVGGGFGTGTIEVRRASGKNPYIWAYRKKWTNRLEITGPYVADKYQLDLCQETDWAGPIVCATDFTVYDHYQNNVGSTISGSVDAHGQTMHVKGDALKNRNLRLNGQFDCSLRKDATFSTTFLAGIFKDPDATYAIYGGTNVLQRGSYIACTNVVADNAGGKNTFLQIENPQVFAPECTLTLTGGAKVCIPAAIEIPVKRLVVGTETIAAGSYTAATLPAVVVGAGTLVVGEASTYSDRTWVGGASGKWSVAENWFPPMVPNAGSTAFFSSAVTLEAETVEIGAGALVIDNTAAVTCNATFTGAGQLVKRGAGKLEFMTKCSYSGGTRLENGEIYTGLGKFIPGPYEIVRANGTSPLLHGHSQNYSTKITVSGVDTTQRTITLDNNSAISGGLEANGDVTLYNGYSYNTSGSPISGGVSAHGHTIYFTNADNNAWTLKDEFDASLDFSACKAQVNMNAALVDPASTYTIRGGTHIIGGGAVLGCKEVVVDNSANKDAVLQMTVQGFRPGTALKVVSGGKVDLPSGIAVVVSSLVVGTAEQPADTYTAATLPNVITGTGKLIVGGSANAWVGGASGTWNDPACWFAGHVPAAGEAVYFAGTAEVKAGGDAVVIGPEGLVIDNNGQVSIRTVFTGPGSLTKTGAGDLWMYGTNTFTGGAVLTDGRTALYDSSALGRGTVEVRRENGKIGTLYPQSGCAMTNRIEVTGPYTANETTIYLGNNGGIFGPIYAEDDIRIENGYTPAGSTTGSRIQGGIYAHGHTVHMGGNNSHWVTTTLAGPVDASIESANLVQLHNFAEMLDETAAYTILCGSNIVYDVTGKKPRTVTVSMTAGKPSVLRLLQGEPLDKEATLTLAAGAKLEIAQGVRQRVKTFTAGETTYTSGRFKAADLPDCLLGGGWLKIGGSGFVVTIDGTVGGGPAPEPVGDGKTLFFAGDSTLDCHYGDETKWGSWGYNLIPYLKATNKIDDRAKSGYSTSTFNDGHMWDNLLAAIKPGDYVYIAFGHNDMSTGTSDPSRIRFQVTIPDYQGHLRTMVDEVSVRGGVPVIGTPIVRNTWSNGALYDGTNSRGESLKDYGDAAAAVAAEKGCAVVDMNAVTHDELERIGPACAVYFAPNDGTHPNPIGARRFAQLFLQEVRRRNLPIAELFK